MAKGIPLAKEEIQRRIRLIKKYRAQGLLDKEIAEKMNTDPVSVCRFIKKFAPELRIYGTIKKRQNRYKKAGPLFEDPIRQRHWDLFYRKKIAQGSKFEVDFEDIKFPERCPVLGTPLHYLKRGRSRSDANKTPSFDRIDSTKGYVKGNVAVISLRANTLKNNATVDELKSIIRYMSVNSTVNRRSRTS